MGYLTTSIVLVIVRALGMIKKETDKHIDKISGSPNLYEIQNISPCGVAHPLRRALLK